MSRFFFFMILNTLGISVSSQTLSISEIQGATSASPYNNQTVSTKGAVTGVYKDGYFIRDGENEWEGIYVYDPGRDPIPRLGDTILFSGLVDEYYDWTEIKNIANYSVISSGNPIPEPMIISAEEVEEGWESCLVTIENVTCTNTNLGYGEWEVEDQSGTLIINDLGIPYTPELGQVYTITGNLSYSFGAFKLEPRDLNDIQIMAPIYFTAQPYATSIETTSITINWSTNSESSTVLEWGYTKAFEQGQKSVPGMTLDHSVSLDGLAPATIIFVQASSESGEGNAESNVHCFITASESSGKINVAFNRTYTDLSFEDSPELFTHNLADTIVKYIRMAEQTLDIAFYDFTDHSSMAGDYNSGIADAMMQAAANGVKVRFITDKAVSDAAPGGEGSAIPRLDVDHNGIMHHKFMIIDHTSVNNSWIVTGSTNPNYNNLVIDFNNLISIQDQSLAKGYLVEFNELWGREGDKPDLLLSRSGAEKEDNSPHQYLVNGTEIQLYFSPSDHTTTHISKTIMGAESSVDFAMMAFTENKLGDAIIAASNNGAEINGVIDYVEYSGSEYNYLTGAGLNILDYKNPDASAWPDGATVHHKFAVIDAGKSNASLISGSHNWTASAESKNDENTLIIHDQNIAGLYKKEFDRIKNWLQNPPVKPQAYNDAFEMNDDEFLIMDVLSNDEASGNLNLEIITGPKFGTYEILEDLTIKYYPGIGFGNEPDTLIYLLTVSSYPQFSDSAIIEISPVVNYVEHTDHHNLIHVYPNPVTDIVYVSSGKVSEMDVIRILDGSGRVLSVKNSRNSYRSEISLFGLERGIYFLDIRMMDSRRFIRKIVVE